MANKERFIKAHFELAKQHLWERWSSSPDDCGLCVIVHGRGALRKMEDDILYLSCAGCTQALLSDNFVPCTDMGTYPMHTGSYNPLRAKYHIEAVKILRGIPSKRFTKKGWVGFPELWELDARLAEE